MLNHFYQNYNLSIADYLIIFSEIILIIFSRKILLKYKKKYPLLKFSIDYFIWIIVLIVVSFSLICEILKIPDLINQMITNATKLSGWYHSRRIFQALFIMTILISFFSVTVQLKQQSIRIFGQFGLIVGSLFILTTIYILDIMSYHYTDAILNMQLFSFSFSHILKGLGIGIILFSAYKYP